MQLGPRAARRAPPAPAGAPRPRRCRPRVCSASASGPEGEAGPPPLAPLAPPAPPAPPTPQPPQPRPAAGGAAGVVTWGGRLPSRRRAALGFSSAAAVALVGNLGGLTSGLLGLDGGAAAGRLRLDALFPVNGFRRAVDRQNGFEFLYPAAWLADQRLFRRYAERVEREAALDPPPLRGGRAGGGRAAPPRRNGGGAPEPAAAYGPAGSTGEDNVSVIVAPIRDGFRLESMGAPEAAARAFLENTVAPPGSGKAAALLAARARRDAADGELYYEWEFEVEAPGRFRRRCVAAVAARNGLLYSLTGQCAAERWEEIGPGLRAAAASFRLLDAGAGARGFPDGL
jgi:hypothetical protein